MRLLGPASLPLLLLIASCKPGDEALPRVPTPTPMPLAAADEGASPQAPEPEPEPEPTQDFSKTRGGGAPAKDDTLLLHYGQDPDTVNLITSNDTTSGSFQQWVYEGLAERNMANPDRWEPVLATRWSFDPATLEYTIHLRKGVRWHPMKLPDGRELPSREFTARDVKFTFDCILNKHVEAAALRSYYEDPSEEDESKRIKIRIRVVDDHTIKIRWSKPYFMADEFTIGIGILPRHVYSVNAQGEPISFDFSSKEFADGFNNHWANGEMCGTGPMIFREWQKNVRVVLERNPDYWGHPFHFHRVVFQRIDNPNTAVQKMLQNELDWVGISEKDHYVQHKKHESVTSGRVKLVEYDYPVYRYMGFNQQQEFFKDRKVRWAMGHLVPIDDIIAKLYHGLARRTTGPFLLGSSAYNPDPKPLAFDLDRARALLDEAGWKDTDGDGVRDKLIDGVRFHARFDLMIYATAPIYNSIAELIKDNARRVGVDVRIEPAQWALMLQKLRKKEFHAVILGWALSWRQDPFQIWHGSQADVTDSSNSIGYRNPEVDRLIETLRVTMDTKEQTRIYHEIHRLIYEDQPYTFLFVEKSTAGHHRRLNNVQFYKPRPCIDIREWSSSPPRKAGE
jgi:peptide/nickel transport system substrate-binding protein